MTQACKPQPTTFSSAYYNLVKVHSAIRMTPAMKADVTRKPWSMADLLAAAGPHC
jgi:hypothetical protein